jgi:hypothetical protein
MPRSSRWSFPSALPITILYSFPIFFMRYRWSVHLIVLEFIILLRSHEASHYTFSVIKWTYLYVARFFNRRQLKMILFAWSVYLVICVYNFVRWFSLMTKHKEETM